MMKKIVTCLGIGIVFGTFIGLILSVFASLVYSQTEYMPATPAFMSYFSNEIQAMLAAIALWSAIGSLFSLASLIYSETDWSVTKMTLVHFILTYLTFLPLATIAGWTSLKLGTLLEFTLTFLLIYVVIWLIAMLRVKKEIDELNKHLQDNS